MTLDLHVIKAHLHQTQSEPAETEWRYHTIMALCAEVERLTEENAKLRKTVENHREVLADMVNQFAYRVSEDRTTPEYWWFHDGGLSTLEEAIPALVSCGWMRRVVSRPEKDWYEFVTSEARALLGRTP